MNRPRPPLVFTAGWLNASPKVKPASVTNRAGGRLVLWLYLLWQMTIVVEGPLRGALVEVDLPNLIYARDLFAAIIVVIALLRPLVKGEKLTSGLTLMSCLLLVHFCVGLMLGGTLFQRLFGLKIFMPLLLGVIVFPAIQRHMGLFTKAMAWFFVISVAGVFANEIAGVWPWEGQSYSTVFGTVDTTRQWWMTSGVRRLPGFARASFDAAMIVGLSGVVTLAFSRKLWVRLLITVAGMAAIALTTSKAMILAFAIASLWLSFSKRSDASFRLGKVIAMSLLLLTCLVPMVFMVVDVRQNPSEVPTLLASLWDRFSWMWPNAYALLPDHYGALSGVGPGGIGSALDYPQPLAVANAGDSIFVYFYVTFGMAGALYLAFPVFGIMSKSARALEGSFAWAGLLIIAYGYGLSINMVEQGFFTSMFGLMYGAAFAAWPTRHGPTQALALLRPVFKK